MKGKELLFVMDEDEELDEGLSYAVYLAGMLGHRLRVLLVGGRGIGRRLDDLMAAITFAEADEHETAREMLGGEKTRARGRAELHAAILKRCRQAGVEAVVHSGLADTLAACLGFLKLQSSIEMILLSPGMTLKGAVLNRLVRKSSRPVVTMAR